MLQFALSKEFEDKEREALGYYKKVAYGVSGDSTLARRQPVPFDAWSRSARTIELDGTTIDGKPFKLVCAARTPRRGPLLGDMVRALQARHEAPPQPTGSLPASWANFGRRQRRRHARLGHLGSSKRRRCRGFSCSTTAAWKGVDWRSFWCSDAADDDVDRSSRQGRTGTTFEPRNLMPRSTKIVKATR